MTVYSILALLFNSLVIEGLRETLKVLTVLHVRSIRIVLLTIGLIDHIVNNNIIEL
jgi:hypothetical protein